MNSGLKEQILKLRIDGKTYNEIRTILNCSKATISYHCKRHNVNFFKNKTLSSEEKDALNVFYKTNTLKETAKKFNISVTSVIRYSENKHIKLTVEELKKNNYSRLKSHRQKLKERAIEYKGGECIKCGYTKCNRALEFHHLDPNEKDFTFGYYKVLSWDKIIPELDKCILVCSNCHREIHDEIDNMVS
jgi:hypothetical protein